MSRQLRQIEWASYRCACCEREWIEELPPLWSGLDMWPACCGIFAKLIAPVAAIVLLM